MQSVKDLFGKRIKELRKARNLTQEQLAELVDIDTRNIENSETFPRAKTLDKLLEVFQISASEIFQTAHLENSDLLRKKIFQKLEEDEELTKLIYKMLF